MNRGVSLPGIRSLVWFCGCLGATWLCASLVAGPQQSAEAAQRAAERLRALQQESAALASQEKTVLTELRQLEINRQIRVEELANAEAELKSLEQRIAASETRTSALRQSADVARPDIDERLVRLYKMGRGGYWRLLLGVDDVAMLGRAYRLAAAMTASDREKVHGHHSLLQALEQERASLDARAKEMRALKDKAASAREAADRAVAARAALVASIEQRKELADRLARELEAAYQRLQAALFQSGGRPVEARLPLRPFKGDLPWPATGIVTGRFGEQRNDIRSVQLRRNGIELSLAEGQPVASVHEGIATSAGPFVGFGNLVIIDHGDRAFSVYGHLSAIGVNKGDRVEAGGRLGVSGRNPAGNPALYFELRVDGKPVDPLQWLRPQ